MCAQAAARPVYEELEGWEETTRGARSFAQLPANAVKYVKRLEELVECPVVEREARLGDLALDELRRAAPVRLGIELPKDRRLRVLCEAVLREPSRHATLDGWARETAASPRTVARLFRQQLDTSFGPWRQQVLLAHALHLAAQGRPMGLIAAELGYASPSAFSAMVRRAVGQPPSRFFAPRPGSA